MFLGGLSGICTFNSHVVVFCIASIPCSFRDKAKSLPKIKHNFISSLEAVQQTLNHLVFHDFLFQNIFWTLFCNCFSYMYFTTATISVTSILYLYLLFLYHIYFTSFFFVSLNVRCFFQIMKNANNW